MGTYPSLPWLTLDADGIYMPAGSMDTYYQSLREAAQRPSIGMIFGDSIQQGYNALNRRTQGHVALALAEVQSMYGRGGEGLYTMIDAPHAIAPGATSYVTTSGTWVHFSNLSYIGADATTTQTAWVEWPSVRGSDLFLHWSPAVGSSQVAVEIDGVRTGTIPLTLQGSMASAPFVQRLPGHYGDGYHKVRISVISGTGAGVTLLGIEGRCNSGVRWHQMTHYGWSTPFVSAAAWSGASIPTHRLGRYTIRQFNEVMDLFVYCLGGNDPGLGLTPSQSAAQLVIAFDEARTVNPNCSILMMVSHPGNGVAIPTVSYTNTILALLAAAQPYNPAVVDLWAKSNFTTKNWAADGDGGDAVHPGAISHRDFYYSSTRRVLCPSPAVLAA